MKWQQVLLFGRGRVKIIKAPCHTVNSLTQQLDKSTVGLVLMVPWQRQCQVRIDHFTIQVDCVRIKVTDADAELVLKPTRILWQIEDF